VYVRSTYTLTSSNLGCEVPNKQFESVAVIWNRCHHDKRCRRLFRHPFNMAFLGYHSGQV